MARGLLPFRLPTARLTTIGGTHHSSYRGLIHIQIPVYTIYPQHLYIRTSREPHSYCQPFKATPTSLGGIHPMTPPSPSAPPSLLHFQTASVISTTPSPTYLLHGQHRPGARTDPACPILVHTGMHPPPSCCSRRVVTSTPPQHQMEALVYMMNPPVGGCRFQTMAARLAGQPAGDTPASAA